MKAFLPDMHFSDIYSIDLAVLEERGIKCIFLDLDNTLVPHNCAVVPERLVQWIRMIRESGFLIKVLSNNNEKRVKGFCDTLDIPFSSGANKPFKAVFLKSAGELGFVPRECAVIGDQIYTDIWGGNRSGMLTVHVEPVQLREGLFFKFKRLLETPVIRKIKSGKGDLK